MDSLRFRQPQPATSRSHSASGIYCASGAARMRPPKSPNEVSRADFFPKSISPVDLCSPEQVQEPLSSGSLSKLPQTLLAFAGASDAKAWSIAAATSSMDAMPFTVRKSPCCR